MNDEADFHEKRISFIFKVEPFNNEEARKSNLIYLLRFSKEVCNEEYKCISNSLSYDINV